MTVTITQDLRDIGSVPDNVTVRFGSPVARQSGSSLITTKWTSFTAVNGILTAVVEPGPAKVMIRHVGTFDITIPGTNSDLWSLIQAAVALPPTTSADQLAQAIGDYFSAHPPTSNDEYHEYANLAAFPATGVADRIYVAVDTGLLYRWTGSAYSLIGGGGGGTAVEVATHAAASKTTPVDADEVPLVDSAASNGLKKLTFANLKAWVKSWIVKADVGLGSVDNTADTAKPVSTAQQTALDLKAPLASPTFTGTVAGVTKTMVGLGSVDNTADTAKPVSTAQQTALDLKAPLASPTFTGTVSGVTKAHVGLGNVDNTADVSKPVSTAQQTAINTGVSTQSVTDTPPLLRKTVPPATRFPTGSKMQTAFQSGHGWTKFATGTGSSGSVADDTTNFVDGSQSFALITSGTSNDRTIAMSPVLSPTIDLTQNSLVFKFRVDLWSRLQNLYFMCSSDTSGQMATTRAEIIVATASSLLASDGEFVWIGVNPGDWATSGGFSAVNLAAVARIAVQNNQGTTGAVRVNLQQMWTRPAPTTTGTIITFDDGYLSQYTNAKPYMDKYGMKGVAFPIRDAIPAGSGTGLYMGTTELQALYDNGWDISAHADLTASHNSANALLDLSISDGTATTLSTFEGELTRVKKWLIANGWIRGADFFAWPQGKFDAARLALARKYFTLIRIYRPALFVPEADTYPFVDGGRLRQIAVQSGVSPTAAATVTAALTAAWAAKKTVVLTFHGINSTSPQSYDYPVASFQTIIDHIAASGFPVKTLSEVTRDGGMDSPINQTQLDTKATIPTGTPTGAKFFRDDYTWSVPGAGGDIAGDTHAATGKTTPVDADEFPGADSAASFGLKKFTWANVKATLKATMTPSVPTATQSGLLGWTMDPLVGAVGTSTQTVGFVTVSRIMAEQSGTCANLVLYLGTLASGMTSCTFQLFDSAGTEVANTGDVKASLTSPAVVGGKSIPWITPVAVVAGGTYYAAMTPIGGTGPALGRAGGATTPGGFGSTIIPFTRFGQVSGSVSSPPTSITPGSLVAAGALYWFALKT